MRSINYVIRGKPSNTSDCLDYSLKHKPRRVILDLFAPEEVNEEYALHALKGSFVWFFDDRTVSYEVTFGLCFEHEPASRQQLSVERANMRLEQELARITTDPKGLAVENSHLRFEYSEGRVNIVARGETR